jgi:choline dehydrogenase-like flavoprotein
VYLAALGEMAPNPESRVTLGETRDALGMRRVRMDWRLGELERRTALEYARTVASELARLGLGSYDLKQAAALEDGKAWVKMATDSYHHMGTTRMHENPRRGVVDVNGKMHGVANLFIAGSSIFPTAGAAPPTLTIVALALRLADHLKSAVFASRPLAVLRGRAAETAPAVPKPSPVAALVAGSPG